MGQGRQSRAEAQSGGWGGGRGARDLLHFGHYFRDATTSCLQRIHFTGK